VTKIYINAVPLVIIRNPHPLIKHQW